MKVPLKKAGTGKEAAPPKEITENNRLADEIIRGVVEIDTTRIPEYIAVLDAFEKEAAANASYTEAEIAQHKKRELKELAKKIEKQKATNSHLKEKVSVEEAYLNEFNEFQLRWSKKLQKFEEKVEESRKEMVEHQKQQIKDAINKIEEKFSIAVKETNNSVLNLQKIEQTLARQKKYTEAKKTREEWMKEKESWAIRQRLEVDKKKNDLMAEYEIKNKKEIEDFIEKINQMRINLENERKKELDDLVAKYDKIKVQLRIVQDSEAKRIEHQNKYTGRDLDETQVNISKNSGHKPKTAGDLLDTKKKIIMKKINRLNTEGAV